MNGVLATVWLKWLNILLQGFRPDVCFSVGESSYLKNILRDYGSHLHLHEFEIVQAKMNYLAK